MKRRNADLAEGAWLGLDIGGSKLVAALVLHDCSRILSTRRVATDSQRGPEPVFESVVALGRELVGRHQVKVSGVGVGFAGLVDHRTGIVDSSVILPGWDGFGLGARMEAAFGLPCAVDNDATAAGLGEFRAQGAPDGAHFVLLTVGTGIGGAIILDGEIYRGRTNTSAEFGNTTIDWQGAPCVSGNRGSLNTLASGRALGRRAAELARAASPGSTSLPATAESIPGELIASAARAGDPVAKAAIEEVARALGTGIANILNIFNPDQVVLTGGLCNLGANYLALVREEAKARAFRINAQHACVGFSIHGDDTTVHGAACLAASRAQR